MPCLEETEVTDSCFLEFFHKLSETSDDSILGPCSDILMYTVLGLNPGLPTGAFTLLWECC